MGNSGLSSHFRVVRALVWVAVGDTAGLQGPGTPLGMKPGPGQSVSAKWNPHGPISKAICKAELLLCLGPRTPHLWPQPGKMRTVRATVASEAGQAAARVQPPGPAPALCRAGRRLGGETGGHTDELDPDVSHTSLARRLAAARGGVG